MAGILYLLLLILAGLVQLNVCQLFQTNLVSTSGGFVRGKLKYSMYENKPYYSYLGIPYGKPADGDLLFKPPQPADPWFGILNCFEYADKCYQIDRRTGFAVGSNNCLNLNVFVPADWNDEPLPVFFFIMGGAFLSGSSEPYGPDFLINQNLIVITFDYRLGPYGFLSLGTPEYSGNMGLKDQVLALKWVRDNIANFGGDPNRITLSSQSAGAVSTNIHLISPLSKGLFQRAIMSSGALIDPWAFHYGYDNLDVVLKFSKETANITQNGPELVEYLKTVSPFTLLSKTYYYFVQGPPPLGFIPNFGPVIEVEGAVDPIITKSPIEYFLHSEKTNITTLFGFNSAESLYFIPLFLKEPHLLAPYNEKFQIQLSFAFLDYDYNSPHYAKIAQQIKYFYFNNEWIGRKTLLQMSDLVTDNFFVYPARKSALLQHHLSPGNTYFYKNSVVTKLNLFRKFSGAPPSIPGPTHCDELFYLFKIKGPLFYHPIQNIYSELSIDSLEVQMINLMTSTWANFIRTGNPHATNSVEPTLPIVDHIFNYMHFTNFGIILGQNPNHERLLFWRDFYHMNHFHVNKIAYCEDYCYQNVSKQFY